MTGTILFDILDFWHAGAGHGTGRFLDAAVKRTPNGLPFLPGRTVKGLFRDAAQQCEDLGHLPPGEVELLFGSRVTADMSRFETEAGLLQFGNAELDPRWESFVQTERGKALLPGFFETIASTSIDRDGLAEKGSLRRIEAVIPLSLKAQWSVTDGEAAQRARTALEMAAGLIRRLGHSRNRGLGRCQVSLEPRSVQSSGGRS